MEGSPVALNRIRSTACLVGFPRSRWEINAYVETNPSIESKQKIYNGKPRFINLTTTPLTLLVVPASFVLLPLADMGLGTCSHSILFIYFLSRCTFRVKVRTIRAVAVSTLGTQDLGPSRSFHTPFFDVTTKG